MRFSQYHQQVADGVADPFPFPTIGQYVYSLTLGYRPQLFIAYRFWPAYPQYASETPVDEDLYFVFDKRCQFPSLAAVQQHRNAVCFEKSHFQVSCELC